MLLPLKKIKHVNSINHEGKIVIIATDLDGQLFYTIRQEGHEENFDKTQLQGWEDWMPLPVPHQSEDPSVREREGKALVDQNTQAPLLRAIFATEETTATAPVQLISGLGHLFVFRQQKNGLLVADRFVLDGLTNKLLPKLQVRYKRSRQRYQPLHKDRTGREALDTYDFRDANNVPFLEPSTELSFLPPTTNGWFSVVLVPTKEPDRFRWHIFVYNRNSDQLELWSIAAKENEPFALRDYRGKPGLQRRQIDLEAGVRIIQAPAAAKYDVQSERMTEAGPQLMRDKIRVMLVLPTSKNHMVLAINYGVDTEGHLSEIGRPENPDQTLQETRQLNGFSQSILLPITSLDDISGLAQNNEAGVIEAIQRGDDNEVWVETAKDHTLTEGERVKVSGTTDFNGLHRVIRATKNTVVVETEVNALGDTDQKLGQWEQLLNPDQSVVFDGVVTAYRKMAGNTIRITSPSHGLKKGDQLQLIGSRDFNGVYTISDAKEDAFSVNLKWDNSQVVDIRLRSQKRRGIQFEAPGDAIQTPPLDFHFPFLIQRGGRTVSAWVHLSSSNDRPQLIAGSHSGLLQLQCKEGRVSASFGTSIEGRERVETIVLYDPEPTAAEWTHFAATIEHDPSSNRTQYYLLRDGNIVDELFFHGRPAAINAADPGPETYWLGGPEKDHEGYGHFHGKLSSVQLWDEPRSPKAIRDGMYLELNGAEGGLIAYYPMGGIIDTEVIDISRNGLNGQVMGSPYPGERQLSRRLRTGGAVDYFRNDGLIAISQGATYAEEFEFRLLNERGDFIDANHPEKQQAFQFDLWGKESHNAEEPIRDGFSISSETIVPLDGGWYRASCHFTTPHNLRLFRLFGLRDVHGDWQSMEIRQHHLTLFHPGISLQSTVDELRSAATLADSEIDLDELSLLEKSNRWHLIEKKRLEDREDDARRRYPAGPQRTSRITRLEGQIANLERDLVEMRKNPLNYFCTISFGANAKEYYLRAPKRNRGKTEIGVFSNQTPFSNEEPRYRWEIRRGGYNIRNGTPFGIASIFTYSHPSSDAWPRAMEGTEVKVVDPYHPEIFLNLPEGSRLFMEVDLPYPKGPLDTYLGTDNQNLLLNSRSRTPSLRMSSGEKTLWTIRKALPQELSPYGAKKIGRKTELLDHYRQELRDLQMADQLPGILADFNRKIDQDQTLLNEISRAFLDRAVEQQLPQEMPSLNDRQGFDSRAAYLSFVKTTSRLHLTESCEGNLILSYFDTRGSMRQSLFDATADARNNTFEQWVPESLKACLDFSVHPGSEVTLDTPLELKEDWTLECWFSYPFMGAPSEIEGLPSGSRFFLFQSGQKGEPTSLSSPAAVSLQHESRDGVPWEIQELGVYQLATVEGIEFDFRGCGFDMRSLDPGWHHMAVRGSGSGTSGTVTFFIDGQKAGDDIRSHQMARFKDTPEAPAVLKATDFNYNGTLNGIGRHVGQLAEVRIWDVGLSPEEIEINSRSFLSGNEPGLRAYYPLSEGQGTTIRNHANFYPRGRSLDGTVRHPHWGPLTAPIGHPGDQAVSFSEGWEGIQFKELVSLPAEATLSVWFKSANTHKLVAGRTKVTFTLLELSSPQPDNASLLVYLASSKSQITSKDSHYLVVMANNLLRSGRQEFFNFDVGSAFDNHWHHVSISFEDGVARLLYDGTAVAAETGSGPDAKFQYFGPGRYQLRLGSYLKGQMADLRIWDHPRSAVATDHGRFSRLVGNEEGLLLYCPLNEVTPDGEVLNFRGDNHGQTHRSDSGWMRATRTLDLPIGSDAVVSNEYPTVAYDPEAQKPTAMMWRFLMTPRVDQLQLFAQKRIELLEEVWIGNGQFDPTLLGFIEGAPPVPSENLTVEEDYSNATSVALSVGKNTEYSWERTQDVFTEVDLNAKVGAGTTITTGVALGGLLTTSFDFQAQAALATNFRHGAQNASQITSASALNLNDSLALRGSREEQPSLPNIGRRFLPKNIGYALVISSMADIFILRLKRSKKMISYKVLPLEGIPPQVNTITFMINPTYCLNGSLDGQVGTSAADDRFYKDIPEMRVQFGSNYPASYLRLEEAMQLQSVINQRDKEREAYYLNFDARNLDEASLDQSLTTEDESIREVEEEGGADEIDRMGEEAEGRAEAEQEEGEKSIDKYRAMARSSSKAAGLAAWQTKMEKLLVKAGKQNIVNAYVWDADGGLHVGSESFANSITHSIGGSFSFLGSMGFEMEVTAGISIGLGVGAGVGVELTMSKSSSTAQQVALDVDLSGMEHRDITDHLDRPLFPGEKVDRYRFSSFFLEGDTRHFNDFFNYVVDPEWLASNDEEARALRMINTAKPNKTWRILHRVTYVERPALLGFGTDTRSVGLPNEDTHQDERLKEVDKNVREIESTTNQLKRKIDQLEEALAAAEKQNQAMAIQLEAIITFLKDKLA